MSFSRMRPGASEDAAERVALAAVTPKEFRSASHSDEPSEAGQAKTRILVVEDDFLIALQTEAALTEAGFDVVGTATTAEEAVSLARAHRPALAVMDIRLASQRDGIDAAAELFKELGIRSIFATAHDDPHTRRRAEHCAPLGWLAKPYTTTSLVISVVEALSRLE
jgi:two-component system, response regulator PdtaR